MIGDSPSDDVEGARALGLQAFLLDREGRYAGARRRADEPRRAAGGAQRHGLSSGRMSPKPQSDPA